MDWFIWSLVIMGAAVLGMIAFFLYKKSFKHVVIIRELTGNGAMLITYDYAKSYINKDSNVEQWALWHEKIDLPPPPANAIEIDKKGRKFAELYKLGDFEFVWIVDDHTKETLDKVLTEDAKKRGLDSTKAWKVANAAARSAWLNQTKKAIEMKGKGIMDMLMAAMPYILLAIVVIGVYMTYSEITDSNEKVTEMITKQAADNNRLAQENVQLTKDLLLRYDLEQVNNAGRLPNATRVAPN